MSNYDKYPKTKVAGRCVQGYEEIRKQLSSQITKKDFVLVFDCYPGVDDKEVITEIKKLQPDLFVHTASLFKSEREMNQQLQYILTDDRVFGKMYYGEITDFIDKTKLNEVRKTVKQAKGLSIIYGMGASLVADSDLLVYLDMARWEIQLRYRSGMSNFNCDNSDEDILRKYKRGYFVEWRIADKHKTKLLHKIDYLMDTNRKNCPKLISGDTFRSGLNIVAHKPFRTVPYFDPGVWGGQWMKEVCDLDRTKSNFAWSFDGVPEENSLYFEVEGNTVEIPAMDLILYQPREVLGEKVFARFGAEYPIRFDFLDTVEGQNLSLQVHPDVEYIKKEFGMAYTQDESYYILDAKEDSVVYLGLKQDVDKREMIEDLQRAQRGEIFFDTEKYINQFPAKKHDHFLIPAGTIHCSGKNTMVLEISATPYIFTFKLWDWGRVGLDNKPRPINIEHGEKVIRWERTTEWVKENLVNQVSCVKETPAYKEEHTGLHELEFIETRRYWSESVIPFDTKNTVNMLNLVEGEMAVVESPDGSFEPFEVHYAETFILPASVGCYTIRSLNHKKIGVVKAYVRGTQHD